MGFPAVFSCTYEVKRLRNLGYSLLATALRTDAGAQPPGFTGHTQGGVRNLSLHASLISQHASGLKMWRPLVTIRTHRIWLLPEVLMKCSRPELFVVSISGLYIVGGHWLPIFTTPTGFPSSTKVTRNTFNF